MFANIRKYSEIFENIRKYSEIFVDKWAASPAQSCTQGCHLTPSRGHFSCCRPEGFSPDFPRTFCVVGFHGRLFQLGADRCRYRMWDCVLCHGLPACRLGMPGRTSASVFSSTLKHACFFMLSVTWNSDIRSWLLLDRNHKSREQLPTLQTRVR